MTDYTAVLHTNEVGSGAKTYYVQCRGETAEEAKNQATEKFGLWWTHMQNVNLSREHLNDVRRAPKASITDLLPGHMPEVPVKGASPMTPTVIPYIWRRPFSQPKDPDIRG